MQQKNKVRQLVISHYTIIEMIIVIAVTGILMTAALKFFYSSRKLTLNTYHSMTLNQDVFVVKKRLRDFVNKNHTVFSASDTFLAFSNKATISIKGTDLVFSEGKKTYTIRLPQGTRMKLSRENKGSPGERVILTVFPSDRHGKTKPKPFIRLVACVNPVDDKGTNATKDAKG